MTAGPAAGQPHRPCFIIIYTSELQLPPCNRLAVQPSLFLTEPSLSFLTQPVEAYIPEAWLPGMTIRFFERCLRRSLSKKFIFAFAFLFALSLRGLANSGSVFNLFLY